MKKQLLTCGCLILAATFSLPLAVEAQTKKALPKKQADIYVSGNYIINNNTQAGYFKNGQPGIPLISGSINDGNGIAVAGNDVYVAGMLDRKAVYWKNGQVVQLSTSGLWPMRAVSVTVSGADVYAAGYVHVPNFINGQQTRDVSRARYWKNGQEVLLPSPISSNGYEEETSVRSIFVIDNDVYVIGRIAYGYTPIYWKNGQLVNTLSNGLDRVEYITQVNGSIYAAGESNNKAAYWKNGQVHVLTGEESLATAITVSGNDVYVAGVIGSHMGKNLYPGYGNPGIGKYWKNGQPMELYGAEAPYPTSIAVSGNDVYIVGIDQGNANDMLWKNGQPVVLKNGNDRLHPTFITSNTMQGKTVTATAKTNAPVKVVAPAPKVNVPLTLKEEAEKFLAENATKPGVITAPAGWQLQILRGGTGPKPVASNKVKYTSRMNIMSGRRLENHSWNNKVDTMSLTVGSLAPVLAEGLQQMNIGGKYKVFAPQKLFPNSVDSETGGRIFIWEIVPLEIVN